MAGMTIYERMCADKKYAASVISSLRHMANYEDDDYDPSVMVWLDSEAPEIDTQAGGETD